MKNQYYTYAYLREDGTPYYIGKGKEYRAFHKKKGEIKVPPSERIIFLKKNLTEEEAFKHEIYLIAVLGRKDIGTGILRNVTNGGEGNSGFIHTEKTREKMSISHTGKKKSSETCKKISNTNRGKKCSEATILLMKQNHFDITGWLWITNGVDETMISPNSSIPEGWNKGRKPKSEETLKVMSDRFSGKGNPMFGVEPKTKQMRWYNLDNKEEKMYIPGEQPKGWELGRKKKVRLSALA
jgi:hypothetical protein